MAPMARMIPMARPAFPPEDMPPSVTGTAVALLVAVDEEVGVNVSLVWDARTIESETLDDCDCTTEDGRSDEDADDDGAGAADVEAAAWSAEPACDVLATDA